MKSKISVANLVMLAGGAVTLLFSFFDFWSYGSAWDTDAGAWVTTIPAILALAMVVWSVLELVGTQLPAQVLTFNSNQMKATWGIGASGVMLAFLISDSGGADRGIGFWLMLLGSIAMATGAVMALLGQWSETVNVPTAHATGSTPPPPPPGGSTPPPPPPPPVG